MNATITSNILSLHSSLNVMKTNTYQVFLLIVSFIELFPHVVAGVRHTLQLPLTDVFIPVDVTLNHLLLSKVMRSGVCVFFFCVCECIYIYIYFFFFPFFSCVLTDRFYITKIIIHSLFFSSPCSILAT